MAYVSCMYAPPDPELDASLKQGESARITCLDEQGRTWWLTEDSQVGDWLEYKASGGTVTPYEAPSPEATAKPKKPRKRGAAMRGSTSL